MENEDFDDQRSNGDQKRASYHGQRRAVHGQCLTVRYVGPVAENAGEWLGVEWDNDSRGRHDGRHLPTGIRYFECEIFACKCLEPGRIE